MKETMYWTRVETSIGFITVVSSEKGLCFIQLPGRDDVQKLRAKHPNLTWVEDASRNKEAIQQLQEYFDGFRTTFDLPLDLRVTPFQKNVLGKVGLVPFGETRSYGEIARQSGNPKAARAVGMANRNNPVPIVIPCHRIVGSDGALTGYGGGVKLKAKLLELETKKL